MHVFVKNKIETGGGVRAAPVPQHLARDVRIRHLHLANYHGFQYAGLLRVRVVAREAGAIVSHRVVFFNFFFDASRAVLA